MSILCNLQRRNAEDYRLRYRNPRGCSPNTCHYFMGINTNTENKSYLDFYLVGQTTGWVALGFSETDGMVSFKCFHASLQHSLIPSMQLYSDVLGCNLYAKGIPLIADSYNPKEQRMNVLDDSEIATNGNPVGTTQSY